MPQTVDGVEEIVQRAIFRLCIPKGSFSLDKELGSELRSLRNFNLTELNQRAFSMVQQALMPMERVVVKQVDCKTDGKGILYITMNLEINDKAIFLEVNI